MTPDEAKAAAKSWAWTIDSTIGLVILGAIFGALGMSLAQEPAAATAPPAADSSSIDGGK